MEFIKTNLITLIFLFTALVIWFFDRTNKQKQKVLFIVFLISVISILLDKFIFNN
jgi:hypothetical protein